MANGCDLHSIAGDAGFINSAAGNYGLSKDSKALLMGFVPFSMDDFGVKKTSLRAIAKTPVFPEIKAVADAEKMINGRKYTYWEKAKLWMPRGEEFSAFGIDFSSTGVAIDGIEENSVFYSMGFRNGDLIQSVNSTVINDIKDLSNHLLKGQGMVQQVFGLIRNQKKIELTVKAALPKIVE